MINETEYTTNELGEVIPKLLGVTEVAKVLGEGWDRKKVSVYNSRRKLPKPSIIIGDRPFWTINQINKFKEELETLK